MPGNDKIVALPSGERIQFPATMADADISTAIQQHLASSQPGAFQSFKGGPILNAKNFQQPQQPQEGTMGKIGRGGLLGMASGLGIPETQHPVSDLFKGMWQQTKEAASSPIAPVEQLYKMAVGTVQAEGQSGKDAYQGIRQSDPELATHGIVSGVVRPFTLGLGGKEVPEMAANLPEDVRVSAQKPFGIGKGFIQQGAEAVGDENAAAIEKHANKIAEIKQANDQMQGDYQLRQKHLNAADQNAQRISDSLPQIHQAARAEAGAAYGPQPKGTYSLEEIRQGIQDAAQSKLQGNTKLPAAVAKVISDIDKPPEPTPLDQASVFKGAGKSARAAGTLDDLSPKARAKFYEQNPTAERIEPSETASTGQNPPLTAQRIHGFMSELGAAARSGSLAGDEASAINASRSFLEQRLRKLYDAEGRIDDFQNGQAAWKKMTNTFENTSSTAKGGSPVARALATKDPVTGQLRPDYVQAILSDEKAHSVATEMLDRYKHLGAPTNELEAMKANLDTASQLPKLIKWKGQPKEPTLAEFDPIEARKVALKREASSLASTSGGYQMMRDVMGLKGLATGNPMALAYPILRRTLGSGVGSSAVMDWLSKATPEELQMAKDIPANKVALKRAQMAAKKP